MPRFARQQGNRIMLLAIGLIALGFAAGVFVTGLAACFIFGLLHAEAVRAVESHGGVNLLSYGLANSPPGTVEPGSWQVRS